MTWERTYTDEELTAAVAISCSWRGVLRELGLVATSAKAIRSVRNYAVLRMPHDTRALQERENYASTTPKHFGFPRANRWT